MMMFWFKNNRNLVILIALGIVFFFVYSWLFWDAPAKFTSPDETANYYFIKLFAEKNQLKFNDTLNEQVGGIIHPRSMRYADGYTTPVSFLGIILTYGTLAKIVGVRSVLFLTPLISVIGVILFYFLVKEIFSRRTAFLSAVLLFFLPPFWYYTSRGMFHNVLFVDFLIMGTFFLVRVLNREMPAKRKLLGFIFAGLLIGLALITRTSEVVWVGFLLIVLFILNRRNIKWLQLLLFLGVIVLVFLPVLYFNNILYGSPESFAYVPAGDDSAGQVVSSLSTVLSKIQHLVLPFGFHGQHIIEVVRYYLLGIFPWFSIGLIICFAWLLRNILAAGVKKMIPESTMKFTAMTGKEKVYFLLYFIIFVWLLIYYGSYAFYEYVDRTKILLGSSYLRYWLPLFVFGLPLVVWGIEKISLLFKHSWARRASTILLLAAFIILSVHITLFDSLQGLYQLRKNIRQEAVLEQEVVEATSADAIIISGYADKVFFPARRVIIALPERIDATEKVVDAILASAPLYFFVSQLDSQAKATFSSLVQRGYRLQGVEGIVSSDGTLYRIHRD